MAIIFRTAGAWGAGKGSNLTPAEVDNNFYELDQRVETLETDGVQPNNISSIQVIGSQMTIVMEDYTTFGPFTLPIAIFHWLGEWLPDTEYSELDIIKVTDSPPIGGVYLVLVDHTSDPYAFDPGAINEESQAIYHKLLEPIPVTFLELEDTPSTYGSGDPGWAVVINFDGDGLTFVEMPYDMEFFYSGGPPTATELLYQYVAGRDHFLLTDLPGLQVFVGTNPTANFDIDIQHLGFSIGTIRITTGGGWITTFATDQTISAGDQVQFFAPGTPDATIADISITLPRPLNNL